MENFKPLNFEQVENEADETFNNDLEIISLETEAGSMEIKKGDTFKWKSLDAVPFRVARIERINKNKVNFLFVTQNPDGSWPSNHDYNKEGVIESKKIVQYLSSAEKMN